MISISIPAPEDAEPMPPRWPKSMKAVLYSSAALT
jgi:hypothetical protein